MIVKYFSIPHVANLFDYVRATGGGKYRPSNMTVVVICDVKFLMQRVTCSSGA